MIKILVSPKLKKEIERKFGIKQSLKIISIFESLKENPQKGKKVGKVGNILIKELKYETFRFYYIVDGIKLKIISKNDLDELIIKIIRMSKKNNQQETINEIKELLKKINF